MKLKDFLERLTSLAGACVPALTLSAMLASAGSAGESFKGKGRLPIEAGRIALPAVPTASGGTVVLPA
ncbi:MAG: hypothetical protein AAB576_03530, partial [Elusimicrobiota bacterium]